MTQAEIIRYSIMALVIVGVMALRFRNVGKMRRLRLEMLWVIPVLYLGITGIIFYAFPPIGIAWAYVAAALGVGAAIGWQRGKMMHIEVDRETHTLNQRTSPAAVLFILAIVLLRNAAGFLEAKAGLSPAVLHLTTDIAMVFALGMFSAQRLEMYLRAKRLLEEARAARA